MAQNIKALIVDDDKSLTDSIGRIFLAQGIKTDLANDGDTAICFLKTGQYDVVLLDLKIPRQDGFSLFRETVECQKNAKIIIMSGMSYEFRSLFTESDLKKVFYWLDKPFDIDYLLKKVKAIKR